MNPYGEALFGFACLAAVAYKKKKQIGGVSASISEIKAMYDAALEKLGVTEE